MSEDALIEEGEHSSSGDESQGLTRSYTRVERDAVKRYVFFKLQVRTDFLRISNFSSVLYPSLSFSNFSKTINLKFQNDLLRKHRKFDHLRDLRKIC